MENRIRPGEKFFKKHLTNAPKYAIIYTESEGNKMFNKNIRYYKFVRRLALLGLIKEETWQNFCNACLEELMEQNQDVLKRLKNI